MENLYKTFRIKVCWFTQQILMGARWSIQGTNDLQRDRYMITNMSKAKDTLQLHQFISLKILTSLSLVSIEKVLMKVKFCKLLLPFWLSKTKGAYRLTLIDLYLQILFLCSLPSNCLCISYSSLRRQSLKTKFGDIHLEFLWVHIAYNLVMAMNKRDTQMIKYKS